MKKIRESQLRPPSHKGFSVTKKGKKTPPPSATSPDEPMRLNKYIAHCGICSRRNAVDFIKEGHVFVNGKAVVEPYYEVQPTDAVTFKGKAVRPEVRKVYLLLNKPKDVITTASDERGRKTVMDIVGNKIKERIFPVGRLDRTTTGLLLLTNDGDLAQKLSHPSYSVKKIYHVALNKPLERSDFELIAKGLELEDGIATIDKLHFVDSKNKAEVSIELHIGKNRIVRRIFEHMGYEVACLDRVYYAGLTKKDLPRGFFRHLTDQEVVMLKHFT
ncbi:MAG: rRNA pseudouridine synthase [Saprospiraceae bacterium]|nr:rRNA pseudouridine synthase [Saprospiraceae bacterium]MBP7679445.1 rRNA pseudouridine synthase [Saprospiraceae bacterium]